MRPYILDEIQGAVKYGSIIGDSMSDYIAAAGFKVPPYKSWPPLLSSLLSSSDIDIDFRAWGIGGTITGQMLGRAKILLAYEVPDLAIVYGGVNDPFASYTGTASAGSVNTITLATSTNVNINSNNSLVGQVITINSGTGAGQTKTIIGYTSGRVATVDSNWSTPPNNTSVYSIQAPDPSQTRANIQALVKVYKYGVRGKLEDPLVSVWNQSQLPSGAKIGDRYVVMRDTSSTGGLLKANESQNDRINGNYSSSPQQSVWECRNPRSGESGWGRVAIAGTPTFSDGVDKIIVLSTNYENWSAGGDNYNTNTSSGTQYPQYVVVRQAQLDAANSENVVFCNLYDYQSKLIYGGNFQGITVDSQVVQGSFDWHFADFDQHHNLWGNHTVATAVFLTISNQEDWQRDLSSQ